VSMGQTAMELPMLRGLLASTCALVGLSACVSPPPAARVAGSTMSSPPSHTAAGIHPPPPTGPEDWVRLYSGIARAHGVAVTDEELRRALADTSDESGELETRVWGRSPAPYVDRPYATLYRADISNDGADEYVLVTRNPVGEHNDVLVGVFRPQPGGGLVEIPVPVIGPSDRGPTFQATPFLSVDAEGVTMRFREDAGHFWFPEEVTVARYLWKGTTVRLLDRAPIPPAPASPPGRSEKESCTVKLPSGELAATFDLSTMTGTLSTDGSAGTRRFQIRAAPYNGTYSLVFVGYGAGDRKPATESMTPKSSVVARLVAWGGGDELRLFLDSDYHPAVQAPDDGFVCQ